MKKQVFPAWRYHKTEGSKIIHSKDESDWHEKKGWAESPAEFEPKEEKFEPKVASDIPDEETTEPAASNDDMKLLMERAMEKGIPKKQLKGKSKEEIEEMINGAK